MTEETEIRSMPTDYRMYAKLLRNRIKQSHLTLNEKYDSIIRDFVHKGKEDLKLGYPVDRVLFKQLWLQMQEDKLRGKSL